MRLRCSLKVRCVCGVALYSGADYFHHAATEAHFLEFSIRSGRWTTVLRAEVLKHGQA